MAFSIITESQLREELGDLTKSTRTADFMPSHVLQAIIDHHTSIVRSAALARVGDAKLPMDMFDPIEISLEDSQVSPDVKEGEIPHGRFPFTPKALLGGKSATLVTDIELALATLPVTVNMLSIKGNVAYAFPKTHESAQVFLAHEDIIIERFAANEVMKARQNIISEARQAVKDRLAIYDVQNKPTEFQTG